MVLRIDLEDRFLGWVSGNGCWVNVFGSGVRAGWCTGEPICEI